MDPSLGQSAEYNAAFRQVRRLRRFYAHLVVYLAVNAGLLVINLLSTPGRLWVAWPLAGWGIAILIHGFGTFLGGSFFGAEWEARKLRELLERRQREPQ